MIVPTPTLAELLEDCDAHGVRLLPAGDDGLAIDAPENALTPELINRLRAHKADVLAAISALELATALPIEVVAEARAVCRCGSTAFVNVLIHGGQSQRRDCAKCGRFHSFPVWHGVGVNRRSADSSAGK